MKAITLTNKGYIKLTDNLLNSIKKNSIDLEVTIGTMDKYSDGYYKKLGYRTNLLTNQNEKKFLRQDSDRETPFIEVDELRISTSWADVTPKEATASTINSQIEGFAIYPNPVTNGRLSITSNSSDNKQVSIFNVLGKNVLNTIISGTKAEVNTSGISAGIYILKVVEGGKTATSKLIIR